MSGNLWTTLVRRSRIYLFAASGGLALFLADYPACQSWLVCLAFSPLLWTVFRASSPGQASACGVAWGIARTMPLAWMLHGFGLPWQPQLALAGYVLLLDAVFALIAFRFRATTLGLFAAAGLFALLEYADSRLPMWGTARSVARLAAPIPGARELIRAAGPFAVAIWLVLFQALLVVGVQRRQRSLVAIGVVLLAGALALGAVRSALSTRTLRAAAIGWAGQRGTADVAALVARASSQHARLVVFPEAAFELRPGQPRSRFEAEWSAIARKNSVFLVVPFLDWQARGNSLLVFDAAGAKLGVYTKRHLVPLAESFPAGSGDLLTFDVDGVRAGTMICQDDNFQDIARAYAARGAQLLVIPTFEGPAAVAPYHFRNSVLRSIENPVALLRAVAQGESAFVAAGGEVIASFDHASRGSGVLVADIPIIERHPRDAGRPGGDGRSKFHLPGCAAVK